MHWPQKFEGCLFGGVVFVVTSVGRYMCASLCGCVCLCPDSVGQRHNLVKSMRNSPGLGTLLSPGCDCDRHGVLAMAVLSSGSQSPTGMC